MLVQVAKNGLRGLAKYKNEYWEQRGITPNEANELEPRYRALSRNYARQNGVPGPYKFFEVRIVNANCIFGLRARTNWWNDPEWMDRVFWMYQKPVMFFIDEERVPFYTLEPFEGWRVWNVGAHRHGMTISENHLKQAWHVPVDCCQVAWEETSAGISDHLHHRPDFVPTQEDIDRRALIEHESAEIMKEAEDINTAKAFRKVLGELEQKEEEFTKEQMKSEG